jgi:hypothetical protein
VKTVILVYRCRGCGTVLAEVICRERARCVNTHKGRLVPRVARKCLQEVVCEVRSQFTEVPLAFGVPAPSELAARLGGKCPVCGKPLGNGSDPLRDVVIAHG